jgi:DNA topoisomerase-2
VHEVSDDCVVRITELPVGTWTRDYKLHLQGMMDAPAAKAGKAKEEPEIKDLKEYHTRTSVCFEVEFSEKKMKEIDRDLEKKLKLVTTKSDNNMVLYNHEGV